MSIKKIAEIVGVSYSTVSRVLNDTNYKCSSEEVRRKILETARDLKYIPNENARNLRLGNESNKKICQIDILVTRTDSSEVDPFFSELIRMVEGEILKNMCILSSVRYHHEFSDDTHYSKDEIERMAKRLFSENETKADGLIIIGKCSKNAIKAFKRLYKCIISVNRNSTNHEIDEVTCDGRTIATLAVEHLISLGHKKIGYVGGCHNETRFKGYKETLLKHNLEDNPDFVIETNQSEQNGYEIMERLINRKNVPTGIYCSNDIIAVGMIKCLNKYRNRYYSPSIISSDDIEEAQYTKPMLSTVRLPKSDMARFALYLLLDRINGGHKAPVKLELQGSLIIRESCMAVDE